MFDLLIKNGTVVDPGAGLEGALDVAISRDRIAAVTAPFRANLPAR